MSWHFIDLVSPALVSILVATGIGLIIGIEREYRKTKEHDHFAGLRTYPIVALLGCAITLSSANVSNWMTILGLIAFVGLVSVIHVFRTPRQHQSITTETSLIITYVLGMMTAQQLIKEALAIMVITTTLLTLKGRFQSFILKITEEELVAFAKFIVLCLLLFPFLPNVAYGPNGILNPNEIGLAVVIVASISFISYIFTKFIGKTKGIILTAIFGGLISSTALTWTFASRSEQADDTQAAVLSAGIILASAVMFLRVAILATTFNPALGLGIAPACIFVFIVGIFFALPLLKNNSRKDASDNADIPVSNPVNILNALAFGALYIGISCLIYYSKEFFGHQGLLVAGFLSGLADVDAITVTIARFSQGLITHQTSMMVVMLATTSNTLVKIGITVWQGDRRIKRKVITSLSAMMASAIVSLLYIYLNN